jgi:hypothetical protein
MTIGCAGGEFVAIKLTNMKLFFFVLNATSGFLFTILLIRFNRRRSLANPNVRSVRFFPIILNNQ